jgi:integrase
VPRTPGIRYFASRGAYYTQYRGKQHLLARGPKDEPEGPTFKAARKAYDALLDADPVNRGGGDQTATSAIITRYYFMLEQEGRSRTLHLARTLLHPAIAALGHVKVKDVKPYMVREWIDRMTQWNSSTRNTAISALLRAYNWARGEGITTVNPIAGISKPEKRVRGKEVVIPEGLMDVLIGSANREFAKVLRLLRGTGCRPGEAMNARCRHYRKDVGALVFSWNDEAFRWKNAKKVKRDRVIYLPPDLVDMVEAEIAARRGPDDYLFQTVRRVNWTANNLVNRLDKLLGHKLVRAWCEKNAFTPDKVMCYSFRHSYITRMLLASCPIKVLADLCGTSVLMIERNYSKASDDHAAMRKLFLQFNGASSSPPPSPPPSPQPPP